DLGGQIELVGAGSRALIDGVADSLVHTHPAQKTSQSVSHLILAKDVQFFRCNQLESIFCVNTACEPRLPPNAEDEPVIKPIQAIEGHLVIRRAFSPKAIFWNVVTRSSEVGLAKKVCVLVAHCCSSVMPLVEMLLPRPIT